MQLLSIQTNRLSKTPTITNNPKQQQQQQNGTDNKQPTTPNNQEPSTNEMRITTATKQQQQKLRKRKIKLNPVNGTKKNIILIYQIITLKSLASIVLTILQIKFQLAFITTLKYFKLLKFLKYYNLNSIYFSLTNN